MLGLVIVDHQAGVDHAGNPAGEREQQAEKKAQDASGHQDRDRRQSDAEKITERFHSRRSTIGTELSDSPEPGLRRRFSQGRGPDRTQRSSAILPGCALAL